MDGMSPYPGEHALGLWFGIVPAVIGALIALYLVWRVAPELVRARRARRARPDPQGFKDHPAMQEQVDALFIARGAIFEAMQAHGAPMRQQDLVWRALGKLNDRAVALAAADPTTPAALDPLTSWYDTLRARAQSGELITIEALVPELSALMPELALSLARFIPTA